ncbi:MAG: methionine--tRNA ligase [Pelagimonas sp.]|jgi:methionyl-tRNA synthetase|nr:methionine--tRNA ligase [Pelagimonas sp.]
MSRYILTVTPPTPNGDLHMGHLSGPFLAADVMRRQLIAQGHDVLMVCYSDDYQSYLPRKAEALGRDPAEYSHQMQRAITLSAELAGVEFDAFPTTQDNPWFAESVNHYLDCISDDLATETVQVHRCPSCSKWGHEAWGRGNCNVCGESSDASQCEGCAAKPTPYLMTDMTCINCGTPMQLTTQRAEVWHLGKRFDALAARHAKRGMRDDLRAYLAEALAKQDDSWPITRPGDAGLPVARFGGDPVHTWFMGLAGYRAAIKAHLEDAPQHGRFADWWSPDTQLVHFLGFDCSYSHAVAYGVQQICDPDGPDVGRFVTNRFLKLDGDDFSTSRGNAVWIKDVTGLYPLDAIRLFTALHAPETQAENFSLAAFRDWIDSSYTPLRKAVSQALTSAAQDNRDNRADWQNSAPAIAYRAATRLDAFSMQAMARAVMDLFAQIQTAPSDTHASGYRLLAEMAAPLMPVLGALLTESKTHECV